MGKSAGRDYVSEHGRLGVADTDTISLNQAPNNCLPRFRVCHTTVAN